MVMYQYDGAGRLTLAKTNDARSNTANTICSAGRTDPQLPLSGGKRHRLRLAGTIDLHSQRHDWSPFDERVVEHAGGRPDHPGLGRSASPWLQTIIEDRDAGSNVIKQFHSRRRRDRAKRGALGGAHRPPHGADLRPNPLKTTFGFADGAAPAGIETGAVLTVTSAPSGLPLYTFEPRGGTRRAGTSTDATRRRFSSVRDSRPTVVHLVVRRALARARQPARRAGSDGPADGRHAHRPPPSARSEAASMFSARQHAMLGAAASLAIEPQRWTASQNDAHQIGARTLYFDGAPQRRSELRLRRRTPHQRRRLELHLDELGRLKRRPTARRDVGSNTSRIRTTASSAVPAYHSDGSGGWTLETRPRRCWPFSDGLPAGDVWFGIRSTTGCWRSTRREVDGVWATGVRPDCSDSTCTATRLTRPR